jgi:hypothetical protein
VADVGGAASAASTRTAAANARRSEGAGMVMVATYGTSAEVGWTARAARAFESQL